MGTFIIKLRDKYLEWSSIVDAPQTRGLTLQELQMYIRDQYGYDGLRDLPERLKRVEEQGTSSQHRYSLEDALSANRAGANEKWLTADQIYHRYCTAEGLKEWWPTNDKSRDGVVADLLVRLRSLSDDERVGLFSEFCQFCGCDLSESTGGICHCSNDE